MQSTEFKNFGQLRLMFQKADPTPATVIPIQRVFGSSPAKEVTGDVVQEKISVATPVEEREITPIESAEPSPHALIWNLEKKLNEINNSTDKELTEIKARTELKKKNFEAFALAQAKAERQEERAKARQKLNDICESIQKLRKENAGFRAANHKKEKGLQALQEESESLQNANRELTRCVKEAEKKTADEISEKKRIRKLLSAFKRVTEGEEIKVEKYTNCAQAENRIRRKYEQLCGDVLTLAADMEQTELAFEFVEQIESLAFQFADAKLLTPPTVSFSEVGDFDPVVIEEVPCVHPVKPSVDNKDIIHESDLTECETEFDEDVFCELC